MSRRAPPHAPSPAALARWAPATISGDDFIDAVIDTWRGSSMTAAARGEPAEKERDPVGERLGALRSAFAKDRPTFAKRG